MHVNSSSQQTKKQHSSPSPQATYARSRAGHRPRRVEHEYFREGAWTYLAALPAKIENKRLASVA
jgi:hypothetical protein